MNLFPVSHIDRLSHRKYGTIELEKPHILAPLLGDMLHQSPSDAAIYPKSVAIEASGVPLRAL